MVVDSDGRVTELEDDAMLPPPAGAAPAMTEPGRIDAAPLRDMGSQNGLASGFAGEPARESEIHQRHR